MEGRTDKRTDPILQDLFGRGHRSKKFLHEIIPNMNEICSNFPAVKSDA